MKKVEHLLLHQLYVLCAEPQSRPKELQNDPLMDVSDDTEVCTHCFRVFPPKERAIDSLAHHLKTHHHLTIEQYQQRLQPKTTTTTTTTSTRRALPSQQQQQQQIQQQQLNYIKAKLRSE
eukprot:UN10334